MDPNHPDYSRYINSDQIPNFEYQANSEYYPDSQFSPNLNQIPPSQFVSSLQYISRGLFPDVHRPNQNQRGAKNIWCVKEDIALMSSWLFASEDNIVCRNQKRTSLWARIHKLYHEKQANNPNELNERNIESMKGRWKRLNENANKWVAGCKEAGARKKSGMSQKDIEKEAHTTYTAGGNKFQDLVVFNEVMCKAPKWNLGSILDTPRGHPESEEVNEQESGGISKRSKTSEDGSFTRTSSISRPEGRDKPKKKGNGKASQSDSNSEFAAQLYNLTVSKDNETELMRNVSNAQLDVERERIEMEKMRINMQSMRMKHKTLDALLARDNLSAAEEELKNELVKIVFGK